MQFENTGVLIAIAGFSLVCAGLLFVGLLLVLRMTGTRAITLLTFFFRRGQEPDAEDGPRYIPRPAPDLRRIAESVDFETAVAKHVVEQSEFGADTSPQPGAQTRDSFDAPQTPTLNRAQQADSPRPPGRRRRSGEYSNDEVFGGLLDDDGDGSVDY